MTMLFSFKQIRKYCEEIKMTECRVHYYDPEDVLTPWSDDPCKVVFDADGLVEFLESDNLYLQGYENLCHGLVMFNENGFVEEAVVA